MSALGHQRHFSRALSMSVIPPIATEVLHNGERRKGAKNDLSAVP
jgi:hypothetical protein